MKFLLLTILVTFSFSSAAALSDCAKEVSQADKNECMTYEKDLSIGRLMTEITEQCAEEPEVSDSRGGTIHSMLLDECMAKKIDGLTKELKKED